MSDVHLKMNLKISTKQISEAMQMAKIELKFPISKAFNQILFGTLYFHIVIYMQVDPAYIWKGFIYL